MMAEKKDAPRKKLIFWLNGHKKTLDNVKPTEMLAYYLRGIGLTGVKIGCGEGGCGSCTVMLTRYNETGDGIEHLAIKSCLTPLCSIDGMAITTIEGIGNTRAGLHPVQYRIAAYNGSQCGFCTPGFVMNMYTLLQHNSTPTTGEIENRFDGNLCRCTGYRAILHGMKTFAADYKPDPDKTPPCCIDPAYKPRETSSKAKTPLQPLPQPNQPLVFKTKNSKWIRPVSLAEVYALKKKYFSETNFHKAMLVVGHTSTGVCNNNPSIFIDISRIPELNAVTVDRDKGIKIGAAVSIQRLIDTLTAKSKNLSPDQTAGISALCDLAGQIASLQIRNTGSIGGNIYLAKLFQQYYPGVNNWHKNKNTTFVSDLFTAFAAIGATTAVGSSAEDGKPKKPAVYEMLKIPAAAETRTPDQLPADAVFINFFIPYSQTGEYVRTYRVADREQDGQAFVNAGFRVRFDKKNRVQEAVLIFGGIGYNSISASKTGKSLKGAAWNEETLTKALESLSKELETLTEMRPNDDNNKKYRISLAEALFYRFYLDIIQKVAPGTVKPSYLSGAAPIKRDISSGKQEFPTYNKKDYPVGKPLIKNTAFLQAAGEAQYTHDLTLPSNGLYAMMVSSNWAAAWFGFRYSKKDNSTIELSALKKYLKGIFPDFVDFITYVDVPGNDCIGLANDDPVFAPFKPDGTTQMKDKNYASYNTVTCVGAPIGLVLAETEETAIGATYYIEANCIAHEDVAIDYIYEDKKVKVALSLEEAVQKNNIFWQKPKTNPDLTHIPSITRPTSDPGWQTWLKNPDASSILGTEVIAGTQKCSGQAHFYLETQSALVIPYDNNRLAIYVSTQNPAGNQAAASRVLGIDANHIDVIVTRIGGGFGGKQSRSAFVSSAVAVAAWKHNRPVKIELFRNIDTTMVGKRHPFIGQYWLAYTQEAKNKVKIKGWKTIYNSDGGNTYDLSFAVMDLAQLHGDNVYYTKYYQTEGYVYRTNRASNTAFRSFGTIQSILIQENAIEHMAHELNKNSKNNRILPEDIRENNFYKTGSIETFDTTPYGQDLMYCNIRDIWGDLKKSSKFKEREEDIQKFNKANRWKKQGISMIPLKYGISYTGPRGTLNQGYALVNVYQSDGTVLVMCGGVEIGQGLNTKMAQIAAQTLGIPLKMIRVGSTDSAAVPNAAATAASTGSDLNGGAVEAACKKLRQRLEQFCMNLEQFLPHMEKKHKKTLRSETYRKLWKIVENWRTKWHKIWPKIVEMAYINRVNLSAQAHYKTPHYSSVDIDHPHGHPFFYFTYSAAVSEVEIDVLTGEFTVLRSDILYDAGKSLNPCIDIGQIEGAFVQGIGYLTTENLVYNENGVLITNRTWNYKPPFSKNIPVDFRIRLRKNGEETTHNGINLANTAVKSSKGIGEPPFVLAASVFFAIKHAVMDARKDQGIDKWLEMDTPATVQRIKECCRVDIKNMKLKEKKPIKSKKEDQV